MLTAYRTSINPVRTGWVAVALLLAWHPSGSAAGTWSLVAPPQGAGEVQYPNSLAVDETDNLYVTDLSGGGRIQKRDAEGRWSLLATEGADLGQVDGPFGLAVDVAGNLYVADSGNNRVQVYSPGGQGS